MLKFGALMLSALSMFAGGCSTYSSNMRVGNDVSYLSIAEQRAASVGVAVMDVAPFAAKDLGTVEAGRCHRMFTESAPDPDLVSLDLKVAAYARGADAIAGVTIEKVSAVTKNCWFMLVGRARALKLAP